MTSKCALCGDPMPEGETMFKFHGLSGPCLKPPLPAPKNEVVAQYSFYDASDGTFSISIKVNGQWATPLGPFDTATERQRVFDDMMEMMRSVGAVDIPPLPQ